MGSRQSLRGLDAKTEDGTSCVFNKSLLFIQKSTIGFIPQILKKVGGQGFPLQCPYADSLSISGVDLEEGRLGDMLPIRWG